GTLLCCCYRAWLLVDTVTTFWLQSCGCSRSRETSTSVPTKPLELRCSRCSMLLLQCLAAGLYNTTPLTSELQNSSCVPAKPLELRRWYLIMLLLQSM